jgi:4-amino-4-deoxy-L-arabinose transferase-like glycosyltransferase
MGAFIADSSRKWTLALLYAWVVLGLFGHDPWKPDEAYSFGLVYEILEHGSWLVPTLAGEPFVEKPPLFYWTAALFAKLFGWALPPHDAARLACAFYVGLALYFVYLASNRRIAAPLLLAASLGYLQHAHQLITDNALMAGIAIGLYGLSASRPLFLGTGAGVAFLAKGLLGPGLLALTALFVAPWRSWPLALAAFAPWALVWPALLYARSPALFDEWLWVQNLGRYTRSTELGGVLDHLHYAKALAWFALPAWPLAAWAVYRHRLSAQTRVPLVGFVVFFLVLSAASSARTLYGLPMLVPLALLAALGLESAPAWMTKPLNWLALLIAVAGAIGLWAAWIAFAAGWRPEFLEREAPGYVPELAIGATLAAIAVTLLCGSQLGKDVATRWLAAGTLVWGLAMTLWLPALDYGKTYRGVIADMQRARPPGQCVATFGLTEPQRAMFDYFAGIRAPAASDCRLLLVHTNVPREPALGGRLLWRGTRPGDTREFFWLFEKR